jgi:hypothetical protein
MKQIQRLQRVKHNPSFGKNTEPHKKLDKACQQKASLKFTQDNIKLNIKGRWNQQRTLKDFWVGKTGTDKLMMMMMMMMTTECGNL